MCRKITLIESNSRKIILFEKSEIFYVDWIKLYENSYSLKNVDWTKLYENTCNLKDVCRKISMIESNCRKIILFEKSDCLCGLDKIVEKFLQFEQFGFN